ncbi:hypothetical protein UB45_06705 [Terrabacter sp. 28]|nr:hypothetical protein UB45_06705 [Terrabacter sp. 28]
MGDAARGGHAGRMTTSTPPAPVTSPTAPVRPAATGPTGTTVEAASRPDRVALLALVAPLLLFAHGIADWVDGLGGTDVLGGPGGLDGLGPAGTRGPLAVATGALLVLASAGLAWLTTTLGARAEHLPVAVPTALLAAFGAGATGAVWVGGLTGFLPATVPTALADGGQVLTALALALVLATTWLEGRMPAGSLALAGVAAALLALPWGLEPLGALVLLIAFAPLTRPVGNSPRVA